MREFFKGWRRKAGCATLVMACLLMVGWLRSQMTVDMFYAYGNQKDCFLGSFAGRLMLLRADSREHKGPKPYWRTAKTSKYYPLNTGKPYDPMDGSVAEWRWDLFDLHIGVGLPIDNPKGREEQCIIPYGFLVIPLALLSAWLLLSKPRPAKPANQPATGLLTESA